MHDQAHTGINRPLQQQLGQGPVLVDDPTIAQLANPSESNVVYMTSRREGWRIPKPVIIICSAIVVLISLAVFFSRYWTLDHSAAIDGENQAVSFSQTGADESMGMGWGCRTSEECKQAVVSLTNAITAKPNSSNALCKRAWIYDTMGQYEHAVQDATQAIRFNSLNADAYEARSSAYAHLGQQDKADLDLGIADRLPTDPH
jgi:tetratricopeptide (TPR) repeat protein